MSQRDRICEHCLMPVEIRNPSGFCDHLYYPDQCVVCSLRSRQREDPLNRDALICLLHNHRCTDPENCSGPDTSDEQAADRAIYLMNRGAVSEPQARHPE